MMFQTIAPHSPPATTYTSIILLFTMSPEIVPATLVPNTNAARKLKNSAQSTAAVGVSTRVATIVAIELAASWNPLRKSNTSAIAMNASTSQTIWCDTGWCAAAAAAAGAVVAAVVAAVARREVNIMSGMLLVGWAAA